MTIDPGPFDLESVRPVLCPEGKAVPKAVTPDFYAEIDCEFDGFAGHLLISQHAFAEAWGTWEIHPKGDEIVYLLDGDIDFVLWVDGAEKKVHVDTPGSYVIVPRNTWHTARPHKPTSMLFITPGEGTENAESPGAAT